MALRNVMAYRLPLGRTASVLPVLCCALGMLAGQVQAAPPTSLLLEELTWTELRDAIGQGWTTIIIPVGGTEQNGPLIALGKHNVRVKALAEKIAAGLGNALVAPVIAYVPEGTVEPPSAHMRFPGTITLPDETFESMLEYAARSFKRHGFLDIVLIGDHGGYQKDLTIVAQKLDKEWVKGPVRVHAVLEYYRASQGAYNDALRIHGAKDNEIGTHAALADTALMLAVDPRLVRQDSLAGADKFGSADGIYGGSPRRATAELGQLGVVIMVEQTIAAIKKAVNRQ